MSCNCISTPCGCTETALTSPVTTVCNNAEPCEEITAFECVLYTGNNIYDIGINNGDRLEVVIKKLALYLTDPTCYDPTAVCQSIKEFEILDVKTVAAIVGITGGSTSAMSFLFLIPICTAALLDLRRGALVTAVFCGVLYSATVLTGNAFAPLGRLVPASPTIDPGRVSYSLLAHLVGFAATALLAAALAERVRSQGRELDERRGAVARLQALNENIIKSINSGLLTADLDGRVNFLNRGGAEILGLSSETVEGRSVEAVFGLERGFLHRTRQELLAKRRFRLERWWDGPDGRRIFLGFAVSNLQDRSGAPLGTIVIFHLHLVLRAVTVLTGGFGLEGIAKVAGFLSCFSRESRWSSLRSCSFSR